MSFRIITLSENTAGIPDVLAEWGLSVLIETDEKSFLLDTGASTSTIQNADTLKIDLQKIDKIILSHGHFDHTGGLQLLLSKLNREIEIIAHPDVFAPKYSHRENKTDRYIGIPYRKEELESLGARFTLTREPFNLSKNIQTTGEIPLSTDFEQIESDFVVKQDSGWQPDQLLDDQAIILDTVLGLVVVLGCGHRGMINTLNHARNITGKSKIHMVLGGSHLKDASEERIWQTISSLNEIGVKRLGLSHCTGMRATLLMAQTYDKDFIFNYAGNVISLP